MGRSASDGSRLPLGWLYMITTPCVAPMTAARNTSHGWAIALFGEPIETMGCPRMRRFTLSMRTAKHSQSALK